MGFKREGLDDRIKLVSISQGAEFEIELSRFDGPQPRFAYVDDSGGSVELLHGLALNGRIVIPQRPDFMWLRAPRDCVVFRGTVEGRARGRLVSSADGR